MEQYPNKPDPWSTPQPQGRDPYDPARGFNPPPLDPYAPGSELTGATTVQEIIPFGSEVRAATAWIVIVVCTIGIAVLQYFAMSSPELAEDDTSPGFNTLYVSRFTVGYERVFNAKDNTTLMALDGVVDESPNPLLNRLRLAIVAGELYDSEAAMERLIRVMDDAQQEDASSIDAAFYDDLGLLERVYGPQQLVPSPAQQQQLIDRHGWFGQLAAGYNLPTSDPLYASPRRSAEYATFALIGFTVLVILAGLIGFVLMIMFVVLLATRTTTAQMATGPPGHRTAYLESVALFLLLFIGLQLAAGVTMYFVDIDLTLPMLLLMPIPLLWPLVCGVGIKRFREDMGYAAPKGFIKEIGLGIVGYLAGLPIVAAGFGASYLIGLIFEITGDHPMGQEIMSGQWQQIALMVFAAVVWAPLVEESVFRAAFYRHLRRVRGVPGWLLATFITAFVFAAIHPQGIVGVPVLMSIAFVLAMLREWRRSLVPSITAHALHNGTLVTFLLLVLYL